MVFLSRNMHVCTTGRSKNMDYLRSLIQPTGKCSGFSYLGNVVETVQNLAILDDMTIVD